MKCKPRKQFYEGKPGAIIVCAECGRSLVGLRFPEGIDILTLPAHYPPMDEEDRGGTSKAETD